MSLPEPLSAAGSKALQAIINSPSDTLNATDFDGTLALGSMIVLGQYGVERWNAVHDEYILPPEPPQMSAVAEELPEVVDSVGLAGVRIEYKGRAVAVHTRLLPDPQGALVKLEGPLRELAARHRLVVEPGKKVWEIRAPGMDKGVALRSIVDETGARQVIFAGDDLGDLPASGPYESLHLRAWRGSSSVRPRLRRPPSPTCATRLLTGLPVLRPGSPNSPSGWSAKH
jgi:trehalose-phosphatase